MSVLSLITRGVICCNWAFRKPRWWKHWWPRSFRPPDDLWDRYPNEVKKVLDSASYSMIPFLAFFAVFLAELFAESLSLNHLFIGLALVAPFYARWGWHLIRALLWARRLGFDSEDIGEFMTFPPPNSEFWRRPEIQQLLLPPDGALAPVDSVSQTPTGYVQALSDAALRLDGPQRDIAGEAASVGREILSAIEGYDRQIEELASDFDAAELDRLKQKLDALCEPDQSDPENKRRMRELLGQQLEFGQGLADQLEAANVRRARLLDLLKTVWLQIANLKTQVTMEGFESSEISQKVQALARAAQQYRESLAEAVTLLD